MAIHAKPEILTPDMPDDRRAPASDRDASTSLRSPNGLFRDENLDLLSHLLDDFIRIPGTPIRFGLDGIVGFIPGAGDVIGGLASSIIILAAWMRGVPRAVVARMVLNVAIETAAGSVPILGNLFDIGWKANRRNYALLRHSLDPAHPAGRRTGSSWLFLAAISASLAVVILVPMLLLGWLLVHVGRHLWGMDIHSLHF